VVTNFIPLTSAAIVGSTIGIPTIAEDLAVDYIGSPYRYTVFLSLML